MNKGIVIAGATGEVGKRLVEKLIARNQNTPIYALVRQKNSQMPPQVTQHVVDFDHLDDVKLNMAFSLAYCCLGTTIKQAGSQKNFKQVDHGYVMAFANWARDHSCHNFACISAVGANQKSNNFYLAVKGETEHDLSQMGWQHLWLIRPSLLLGPRNEFRLGEYISSILSRLISPFLVGSLKKYKPIHMLQVAETMTRLSELKTAREGCQVLEGNALFKS